MSADARKADIKASHVQKAVAKAGVALADSTQALLRAQRAAGKETKEQIQTVPQYKRTAMLSFSWGMHPMTSRSAGDTQYGHSCTKASQACAPTPNRSLSFYLGITWPPP